MDSQLGPDGEKILDMRYYELLSISGNATPLEIKKAYRLNAIKFHPDKNVGDPTAQAKFQEISEAYAVLSDSNLRAVYNKNGREKAVAGAGGEEFINDPGAIFSSMFGGKAFLDWIGEISLGKDVSKAFEQSTTEEEREMMKAELAAGGDPTASTTGVPVSTIEHDKFEKAPSSTTAGTTSGTPLGTTASPTKAAATSSLSSANAIPSLSTPSTSTPPPPPARPAGKTTEQRLAEDRERQAEKRERIRSLAEKLNSRIRPFVESTDPGGVNDQETKRWAERLKNEVEDLASESFGVELSHLIGTIYVTKASSFIRLHRRPTSNILGVPGFFNRLKEKTTMLKEGWSFLSVGLDIQSSMSAMKILEEGPDESEETKAKREEEMRKIESEMSGKLLLVAWKGSKFELGSVLRSVVDEVLTKESPAVSDATLMLRAKAILLCGTILKAAVPDESDGERRELERIVEAANQARKDKKSGKKSTAPPVVLPSGFVPKA